MINEIFVRDMPTTPHENLLSRCTLPAAYIIMLIRVMILADFEDKKSKCLNQK